MDGAKDAQTARITERTVEADAKTEPTTEETRPSAEYASRDQLRAMAHPLRLEIMERVGRRGTARAADLAADLGIAANSVSYHLRILARGGVIEEAPEAARDRRDRVWRLTQLSYLSGRDERTSDNDPQERDPDYLAASGATSLAAFDWMRSAWSAEIARHGEEGSDAGEGLGQLYVTSLRLTIDEMRELNRVVVEALDEVKDRHRDEEGVDLPDPEEGEAPHTFRVLWAAVGDDPSA